LVCQLSPSRKHQNASKLITSVSHHENYRDVTEFSLDVWLVSRTYFEISTDAKSDFINKNMLET
jgi:hypothetical protein